MQKIKNRKRTFIQAIMLLFLGVQILSAFQKEDKIDLDAIGTEVWLSDKMNTYPEIKWLLDKEVEHTQEGAAAQHKDSWSLKLTQSHYPEFERTMATLANFSVILEGSEQAYKRFIEAQPQEDALKKENFNTLHHYAVTTLQSYAEGQPAVEADLVLGDMGKTPQARKLAKEFSIEEHDHDLFLRECLQKCPQIFPTFNKLSKDLQKDLRESTGLVHFGHVIHLEGGPEILTKLHTSQIIVKDPKAFDLQILAFMMDVSGARAHETNRGAKALVNNTFLAIYAMREALLTLSQGSQEDALSHYIAFRAKLLGFEPQQEENRILVRMGAMMRLFTPKDGKAMKDVYQKLTKEEKAVIQQEFDPLKTQKGRTPTYIPAVFVNSLEAAQRQGLTREEALQAVITKGLMRVITFLKSYRENKANQPYSSKMTLNFNKAAGQIRNNFKLFENNDLTVDDQGNVSFIV